MIVPQPSHLARDRKPVPGGGALGWPVRRSRGKRGFPHTGHRPNAGGASPVSREKSSSMTSSIMGGASVTAGIGMGSSNYLALFYHSITLRGNPWYYG